MFVTCWGFPVENLFFTVLEHDINRANRDIYLGDLDNLSNAAGLRWVVSGSEVRCDTQS